MLQFSEKTIERLIIYRRILLDILKSSDSNIYSHQLASNAGVNSAQVRRDLMGIGYSGSSKNGYDVAMLLKGISEVIDTPEGEGVAIVGLGHLGRAILDYFRGRRQKLEIRAAFDHDPAKYDRVFHGVRCYHTDNMNQVCRELNITVGIIAIPPDCAEEIAYKLAEAGVTGILNYAPVKIDLPQNIYIENRDMIMAVEKAAYHARQSHERKAVHECIS